jgi:hypothetical protein
MFSTEQETIVNSRRPRSRCSQRSIGQSLVSFTKSATCESGIVLVSLRMSYPGKSNQVLVQLITTGLYSRDMSHVEHESYL